MYCGSCKSAACIPVVMLLGLYMFAIYMHMPSRHGAQTPSHTPGIASFQMFVYLAPVQCHPALQIRVSHFNDVLTHMYAPHRPWKPCRSSKDKLQESKEMRLTYGFPHTATTKPASSQIQC
jgi:hypothetical protein